MSFSNNKKDSQSPMFSQGNSTSGIKVFCVQCQQFYIKLLHLLRVRIIGR